VCRGSLARMLPIQYADPRTDSYNVE